MATPLRAYVAGDGPPVVLLHGLGLDSGMWGGLLPEIHRAGFQSVTVDVRGHGGSPTVDVEATLDDLTDDVCAVLNSWGITRPHLVGFSMGGMIAMRFAAKKLPL